MMMMTMMMMTMMMMMIMLMIMMMMTMMCDDDACRHRIHHHNRHYHHSKHQSQSQSSIINHHNHQSQIRTLTKRSHSAQTNRTPISRTFDQILYDSKTGVVHMVVECDVSFLIGQLRRQFDWVHGHDQSRLEEILEEENESGMRETGVEWEQNTRAECGQNEQHENIMRAKWEQNERRNESNMRAEWEPNWVESIAQIFSDVEARNGKFERFDD